MRWTGGCADHRLLRCWRAASVLHVAAAAFALNNVWVVLCLLSLQQAFYRSQPDQGGGHSAHAAGTTSCQRPTR